MTKYLSFIRRVPRTTFYNGIRCLQTRLTVLVLCYVAAILRVLGSIQETQELAVGLILLNFCLKILTDRNEIETYVVIKMK